MADIQDSSGIPLSGQNFWQEHFSKQQMQIIVTVFRRAVGQHMSEFFVQAGRADERSQARIRDLESQVQAFTKEVQSLRVFIEKSEDKYEEYAKHLEFAFKESERARQEISNQSAKIEADVKAISHLLEFQDSLGIIARGIAMGLEWLIRWEQKGVAFLKPFTGKVRSYRRGDRS